MSDTSNPDNAPLMILEYMPFGDLQGFLRKCRWCTCAEVHCACETVIISLCYCQQEG